jgi:Spy/CpxP family protein refolding chaperone
MNSWKIILAAVVIFGAGALTGGLLVNNVAQSHFKDVQRPPVELPPHPQTASHDTNHEPGQLPPSDLPKPHQPEILGKQFVQQLDKKLHLTPEQRAAIAKIVAEGQERNHEIWTNAAPQMHKVLQDVRQQIREQLTPEQRKKYEELLKRFRPGGHHPQPPPNSSSPTNEPPMLEPTNPPPGA